MPVPELLETLITTKVRWIKVKAVLLEGGRKIKAIDVTSVRQGVFIGHTFLTLIEKYPKYFMNAFSLGKLLVSDPNISN